MESPGPIEIVANRSSALSLYARQWVDSAAADDVVQDVLIAAWLVRPPPDDPLAWAFRAVRNRAISASRSFFRRRRHERAGALSDLFAPSPGDALDAQTAGAALAKLRGPFREVVVLRLWGDSGFTAIAAVTGTSVGTAHNRYTDAIEQLRNQLETPCRTNLKTD